MRMLLPALAAIVLGGLCSHADAQVQCPEFIRLRNEALDSQKPLMRGGRIPLSPSLLETSCVAYVRQAQAWRALVEYAGENREMCNISEDWLRSFETYRREAASFRDNVCSGRPARAFPAEIIRR